MTTKAKTPVTEPTEAEEPAPVTVDDPAPAASEALDPPATDEETTAAAGFGVTVGQLRAIYATIATPAVEVPEAAQSAAPICGACWPDGWPNDHADHAECEHGEWDR